ncbi:hypothetical protein [Flavobacterium sp. LC2016-13]|uniref:GAP1-N1 domain-containing protein n=1 Tax=Flavobacterium sp. LC2016-13 TaxID=2675875 RepID=UPI0012B9A471|nr:hypothetical protein [Flavobacterium sp. LC2016-13]MTD67668.1 hypothetical protein [Flavobacterium sp. LC2016-13]
MKIKIDQTLHGYQNGHQLLMSSSQLSGDAKKILLVQSDLSGSNIDEGFKIYISGYPLATHYAFSKTWYADEMKRPGCVWTHTLLIQFSDLGKIPDLDQLLLYFKRPIKDKYEDYSTPISIEKDDLLNSDSIFDDFTKAIPVLDAVYNYPEKTIIYPAYTSLEFERLIIQVWSNQWPRLRRNFSFCTGALNLKVVDGVEFDLQIVPIRTTGSIEKQSSNSFIIGDQIIENENWISLFNTSSKNHLRKFLWFYGSDIKGIRRNYKPLIELYEFSTLKSSSFTLINNLVSNRFEDNEGKLIKNEIYNEGILYEFNEKEVLDYFILNDNSNIDKKYINQRLINALKSNKINVNEFVDFYINAKQDLISSDVWENISILPSDIINLFDRDSRLIPIFLKEIPRIAILVDTWKLPIETQLKLIEILENSLHVNWELTISSILESKSSVIYQFLRNNDQRAYYIIKIFNNIGFPDSPNIVSSIFANRTILKDFIRKNISVLSVQFCCKIFQYLNYPELNSLGLDSSYWKVIYKKVDDEQTRIFASCVLLSFGFNRKVSNPALIVAECFHDVYYYAKKSKIQYNNWQFIPIDATEQDEEDSLFLFFSYLFSPKKADVPSWDYCELLIRTLVNKFIKFHWSQQYFLDSLKIFDTTKSALSYAIGFKKGRKFMDEILFNIDKRKIQINDHQVQLITSLRRELRH